MSFRISHLRLFFFLQTLPAIINDIYHRKGLVGLGFDVDVIEGGTETDAEGDCEKTGGLAHGLNAPPPPCCC